MRERRTECGGDTRDNWLLSDSKGFSCARVFLLTTALTQAHLLTQAQALVCEPVARAEGNDSDQEQRAKCNALHLNHRHSKSNTLSFSSHCDPTAIEPSVNWDRGKGRKGQTGRQAS